MEHVFRNTIDALLDLSNAPSITLLTSYHNYHTFAAWSSRVRRVYVPEERRRTRIPKVLAEHDVLWCPFLFLEPEDPTIPSVVSIPDLQHLDYPEFFSREILALRLNGFRVSVSRAKRVLTLSEYSKRGLLDYYDLRDDRVVIASPGYAADYLAPPDEERRADIRRRYELPDTFGIYPANNWIHKNHRGLFRSMAVYRERFGEGIDVILAGSMVPGGLALREEAEQAGVEDDVRHIGYVDRADLPHLYDAAAFLVFPSLFEGFGLPVLEAMARKTPIIASDRTSLPDLVRDFGVTVDPENPEDLASAMHDAVSRDKAVVDRSLRAFEHASAYSYERTASVTLEAIRCATEGETSASIQTRSPKVLIVTPSLEQGKFLRQAIESVLMQDHPVEYFVADGGSTDQTVDILRSFGDRITWVSRADGGQAAAIAEAWRNSDAEIVAWLNSDDTLIEGAVSAAVNYLRDHADVAMVYGKAWYTDEEGRFTEPYPTRPFDRAALARECFICQPAVFLRREVFQVIDLPDPELRYCMDYDLWIRLSRYFGIGYLDEFLATSRVHAETKTVRERGSVYREIMEVVRRHYGSIPRTWTTGYLRYRAKRLLDWFRWLVPRPVQRRVYNLIMHRRQLRLPSAPYADGWVGRRTVHYVRLGGDGWVTICGDTPHWPCGDPLTVQIAFEGEILASETIRERGRFQIQVRVRGRRLVPIALELVANSSYVPRRSGFGSDDRPVSFRLEAILPGRHDEVSG
jgi:glycosyltransferase involved in cell wall biosynthesis